MPCTHLVAQKVVSVHVDEKKSVLMMEVLNWGDEMSSEDHSSKVLTETKVKGTQMLATCGYGTAVGSFEGRCDASLLVVRCRRNGTNSGADINEILDACESAYGAKVGRVMTRDANRAGHHHLVPANEHGEVHLRAWLPKVSWHHQKLLLGLDSLE